jgi:hypothetical protein
MGLPEGHGQPEHDTGPYRFSVVFRIARRGKQEIRFLPRLFPLHTRHLGELVVQKGVERWRDGLAGVGEV